MSVLNYNRLCPKPFFLNPPKAYAEWPEKSIHSTEKRKEVLRVGNNREPATLPGCGNKVVGVPNGICTIAIIDFKGIIRAA